MPTKTTVKRHQAIIERGLDQIGIAGDFTILGNGDYGPEIRAAARKRYLELLQPEEIAHNGRETLLLCGIQSMVQSFVIGYRACLIAHKLPPLG